MYMYSVYACTGTHEWSITTHSIHMRGGGGGGGGKNAYREGVGGEGQYNFNMYMHVLEVDTLKL